MIPKLQGAGLGLRREMLASLYAGGQVRLPSEVDFLEVAPENWIGQGGISARRFAEIAEHLPVVCHGLSLNLGGQDPIDEALVKAIADFMATHDSPLYTEHLSYTGHGGHLYDLLPLPRCEEAVFHVARRIRQVQEILGFAIAIENASAYTGTPLDEMSEWDFYLAVAEEADCLLHLDVNNVYVNSVNFRHDPRRFLQAVARRAPQRVVYLHMAGHYQEAPDFLIDTHGAPVVEPVWELLGATYALLGPVSTCLERDFNLPPLADLTREVARIRACQQAHQPRTAEAA